MTPDLRRAEEAVIAAAYRWKLYPHFSTRSELEQALTALSPLRASREKPKEALPHHEDWCNSVQPIHEDGPCNCAPTPPVEEAKP